MGFTAGIYIRHKLDGLSDVDVDMIESTINYQKSEWMQSHYTYEEYMSSYECRYDTPAGGFGKWKSDNEEQIKWYEAHQYPDEDSSDKLSVSNCIETWCSGGAKFHEVFERFGKKIGDDLFELSRDAVLELLEYFLDVAFSFEEYSLSKAFTSKYNEDEDAEEIRAFSCDGIEIEDECGRIRRLYSEYEPIVAFNGYDCDAVIMARLISLALLKALKEAKEPDEQIFYSGGW